MKKDIVVVLFLKHEVNTLCLCKLWAISFPIPRLARTSRIKSEASEKLMEYVLLVTGLSTDMLKFLLISLSFL